MHFKKNLLLALLLIVVSIAHGQSDIFLSQQWFSRINMNPAATGTSNNVNIFLLSRQQWVGFDNAPKTNILNAHTYFNSIQSGLGLSLLFDKLGVSHQTVNAMLSYAYHLDLNSEMRLSFGLAGGMFNSSWDPLRNTFSENTIIDVDLERTSRLSPDFNAGMELNAFGINFGGSVTHLLTSSPTNFKPGREIYSYLRYRTALNRDYDIAPGIIYRYGNNIHFFDINVMGYYKKNYWIGFSFRPVHSFAAMLGVEFNKFRIGYSYDRSIGVLSSLAVNSHEIMLSVRLAKPQQGRPTTRFLD